MLREKKISYLGLVLTGLVTAAGIFQNCARTNYGEEHDSNASVLSANRKVIIDPSFNQQKANLKVLFVVDDSYTMSQSQQHLANAVDSLLNPLQGHNVDFKIVSTSGVPSNEVDYAISTRYLSEDRLEIPASQLSSLNSYLVEKSVANNSNASTRRHNNLKLFRTSTGEQFTQIKSELKTAILSVGVAGSDVEEGICATVRQLFDTSPNRFFKAGDKAVIVILTDENDNSVFSKCVTRYIQRVSSKSVVYYNYGQQRARVSLEYQLTRDGVTSWNPVVWGISLSGNRTIVNGNVCSTADLNYAVNKITSQGYVIRNVSECVYETIQASYYGADLGDDGSVPTKNLCESTVFFNSVSYLNLYAMVNAIGLSAQAGSCTKQLLPGNVTGNSIEIDSVIRSDAAANNAQNLILGIKNKSNELFGSSGFTIASLIRKSGESCALSPGQSYGAAYEILTGTVGVQNSVTQSLCAGDFSNTLSQVSTYIVSEASSSYVVAGLLETEMIESVTLIRSEQRTLLTTSDYELAGATITLKNITLQAGDTLEVQIRPKPLPVE